ncbi:MAG: efflux RND transporter periplasmic adaptor subunit [Bacteroidia bacterium]|nr:efflux RND transporter periplasmic adaptor subunit [Bacteroidia bacterium]MCF8446203.1 efflux RND transporter periplasmic adaptor subunit [Bacteroidia bacterium]
MKSIKNIGIGVGVILVLLIPKFFCQEKKEGSGGKKPNGAGMPMKVKVLVVKEEFVSSDYKVSGTLMANEQVMLSSETQGRVTHLYFQEGKFVSKGELLLKMNDLEYQAQLKKAISNRKLKQENATRNETLLKKEAISQADYDLTLTELAGLDADIDFLKEQIRKTEIRAPFSGTIGLRSISEGAYLTPNSPIASLQDESKLKLEFSVPEKYALKVKNGDDIQFALSGSDEIYHAKVYARDASVSEQTRTVKMRAICSNSSRKLIPGLFANITLQLSGEKQSIMIPTQAMVPVLKGQKVFLVQGDSAIERSIKTGFRSDKQIEVVEGLNAGDSLIVDGIMYMKLGVKVKVSKN